MQEWIKAYQQDPSRVLIKNRKEYSKILYRCDYGKTNISRFLVGVKLDDSVKLEDILTDEYGREFTIKAFEMINFTSDVPKINCSLSHITVEGKENLTGDYLAKK